MTQRAIVLSQGQIITEEHITFSGAFSRPVIDVEARVRGGSSLEALMDEVRREAVEAAMRMHNDDRSKAAQALSISVEEVERAIEEKASVGILS